MTFTEFLDMTNISYKLSKNGKVSIDYPSLTNAVFDISKLDKARKKGKFDADYKRNFDLLTSRIAQYNRRTLVKEFTKQIGQSDRVGRVMFFKDELEKAEKRGNLLRSKTASPYNKIQAISATEKRVGRVDIDVINGSKVKVTRQSLSARSEERYLIRALAIITNVTSFSENDIDTVDKLLKPYGINFKDRLYSIALRDGSPKVHSEIVDVQEEIIPLVKTLTDEEKENLKKAMDILENVQVQSYRDVRKSWKQKSRFKEGKRK